MKIKVPEAEILRTPIKIEKLSVWVITVGVIANFITIFSSKIMKNQYIEIWG